MKTKAAVSTPSGVFLSEIELRPPSPVEALVRVEAANVAIAEVGGPGAMGQSGAPNPGQSGAAGDQVGPMEMGDGFAVPAVFPFPDFIVHGHAGVGVVEEVGAAVTRVKVGDRVMVTSNPNCGACAYCLRGRPDQCAEMVPFGPAVGSMEDGSAVHTNGHVGSFAEHAVIPQNQLTPVKSELPSDQMSLIANPIATGVGAALLIAPVTPGSVVAVVGCGPVGLSYVQGARLAHAARIIAVDPLAHRREVALRLGATDALDPAGDPVEAVRELSGDLGGLIGRGADFVFEAAGNGRAAEQAWSMARLTGHVVLAGIGGEQPMVSFPYAEFSVIGGRTVHSCQWGGVLQRRDFPWLIELTERGLIDVAALAERSYSLEEIDQAENDVAKQAVIGATLLPAT